METSRIRPDSEGPQIYHPKPEQPERYGYYSMATEDESSAFIDGLEMIGKVGIVIIAIVTSPLWGIIYGIMHLSKKLAGRPF